MKCPRSWDCGHTFECLKEDCAWWDGEYQHCQFVELVNCVSAIEDYLAKIEAKMPHELQFRKT